MKEIKNMNEIINIKEIKNMVEIKNISTMNRMKYIKRYLGVFIIIFVAVSIFTTAKPCFAASAKVVIKSENAEVTVGHTVKVFININSQTTFGNFEANLTYDKDILTYKEGASVISGGNGYLRISDMDNSQTNTNRKYALEFKALKVGECEIVFGDQVKVYDESEMELPVSNSSLTIKVKPQKSASTNAKLKILETDPKDLTPAFDKNVRDYSIKVDSDTQRLIITAIPEDKMAKVKITGNDSLKEGKNKIVITVLAQSGDDIEYTINVLREVAPTVTVIPTITPAITENVNDIIQSNGETYLVLSGKYKILEPGSDIAIPEGYTKSELTVSGIIMNAYTSNNDPDSDFVLVYAQNPSGVADFYRYDKAENTLQRYVKEADNTDKYRSQMNKEAVVIAVLSALCLISVIVLIGMFVKLKRLKK